MHACEGYIFMYIRIYDVVLFMYISCFSLNIYTSKQIANAIYEYFKNISYQLQNDSLNFYYIVNAYTL